MLKENLKIKLHFFDVNGREIITDCKNDVFIVKKKDGKLGIDFNTKNLYTGDVFVSFESFANDVIFEDISTGEKYHFNAIIKNIEKFKEL